MSRRARLHVAGGIYYVIQRSGVRQPIFADASHYAMFERLLATSLERSRSRVHVYCWLPDAIHLVVQVAEQPVGRLMQRLTSQYSRRLHSLAGEWGHLFRQRYQSLLIDPDIQLLRVLQEIHRLPIRTGLSTTLNDYPWSSHHAYRGSARVPWLTTHAVLKRLDRRPDRARRRYLELMAAPSDWGVHGDPRFPSPRVRVTAGSHHARLDRLIDSVIRPLGIDSRELLSGSRKRHLALARALIAWHAIERGITTLAQVARRLHRDPSTLIAGVNRYSARCPELFDRAALSASGPLVRPPNA
ncbi:MAG TPA: transposase [Steroidobacteraceae bacterium]|nr:transposase [Steroidobacteraceae bacterium]